MSVADVLAKKPSDLDRHASLSRPKLFTTASPTAKELAFFLQEQAFSQAADLLTPMPPCSIPRSRVFPLCVLALDCPPQLFSLLLDRCPPLAALPRAATSLTPQLGRGHSLPAAAAWRNRPEHLRLLLERGADLFGAPGSISPLEAAVTQRSDACTALVTAQLPPFSTLSRRLLALWAQAGQDAALDACLRLTVPLLHNPLQDSDALPLPRQLTAAAVLQAGNFSLLLRLAKAGQVTANDARRIVSTMQLCHFRGGREALFAELLIALISVSPALLRCPQARVRLAAACLDPDFSTPQLHALLEELPGHQLLLLPCGVPWAGSFGLLRRWPQAIGTRLYPVLDRNLPLPDSLGIRDYPGLMPAGRREPLYRLDFQADLPELLEDYLRFCSLRGRLPKDGLSPLGQLLVARLPLPSLAAALHPCGALSKESPDALRAFAESKACSPERRQLLLSR